MRNTFDKLLVKQYPKPLTKPLKFPSNNSPSKLSFKSEARPNGLPKASIVTMMLKVWFFNSSKTNSLFCKQKIIYYIKQSAI